MPVLTDCCWRVSAASSLFPALPSSLIDKAPSLTFTKCLFTKWEKFGSKTTRAESKGDLCSPANSSKNCLFASFLFFFLYFSRFSQPRHPFPFLFFSNSFSFPSLIFKALRLREWNAPPPATTTTTPLHPSHPAGASIYNRAQRSKQEKGWGEQRNTNP